MPLLVSVLFLASTGFSPPQEDTSQISPAAVQRIGFGSCFQSDGPAEIWSAIEAYRPDVFILLGDNVYADTRDMNVMRAKYAELDGVAAFARVREKATLLATWDDHDFGENDAGA